MSALKEYTVEKLAYADRPHTDITATLEEPAVGDLLFAVLVEDGFGVDTWTGPTGWTKQANNNEMGGSGSPTVTMWTNVSPGGEGTSFLFSNSGSASVGLLFVGVWDANLMSAVPTETTWSTSDTGDATSTPDLALTANILTDALAITVVASMSANDATQWTPASAYPTTTGSSKTPINTGGTGSTSERDQYSGGGAGVAGYHIHMLVLEEYTSGDFPAETWTITPSTAVNGAFRYVPAVGEIVVEVPTLRLPLRHMTGRQLPYDLRMMRLLGEPPG